MNPLVPGAIDLLWTVIVLASLGLTIVGIVSLSRSRIVLTGNQKLVWALFIVLVPIFGATAWLAGARRAQKHIPMPLATP